MPSRFADGARQQRTAPRLESEPMDGHALISSDILASYAADAAREVRGVRGLVESSLHRHRGVRIVEEDGNVAVELHLAVEWGSNVPELGADVQRRVVSYLERMADVTPSSVDVVVDDVGPPSD
jgi:uncharacterized alkaline shock family protein YloU